MTATSRPLDALFPIPTTVNDAGMERNGPRTVRTARRLGILSPMRASGIIGLSLLVLMFAGCATTKPEVIAGRCALLIGIGEYDTVDVPANERWRNLHGPRNDVALLADVLADAYGFRVATLIDEQATSDGIRAGIDEHLLGCVRGLGDVALLHFSGHGQQIPDDNDDEEDGYDEALVPYDHQGQKKPGAYIRDDEIEGWIAELSEKTNHVVMIVDSCHSGTMTRGAEDEAPSRGADPYLEPSPGRTRGATPAGLGGFLEGGSDDQASLVYLGAAHSNQKAGERFDPTCGDAASPACWNGRFSYWLAHELRQATGHTSYQELEERVKAHITDEGGGQHPSLQGGGKNRLLFSNLPARRSMKTFLATAMDYEGLVEVNAGLAHGVQEGDRFDLYPIHGTLPAAAPPPPLAVVRAARVRDTRTYATLVEGHPVSLQTSTRAVLSYERGGRPPLVLHVLADVPLLAAKIRVSDLFEVSKSRTKPDGEPPERHVFLESTDQGQLRLRDGAGEVVAIPVGEERVPATTLDPEDPLAALRIRTAMESRARANRILALAGRPTDLDAKLELLVDSSEIGGSDERAPASDPSRIYESCAVGADCARLVVRVANESGDALHVVALHVNPDGRTVVFKGSDWIVAGKDEKEFWNANLRSPLTVGLHRIVLVATTEPANFEPLGYMLDEDGIGHVPTTKSDAFFLPAATRSAGPLGGPRPKWRAQSWMFRVGGER
jgi:hypothetical protein